VVDEQPALGRRRRPRWAKISNGVYLPVRLADDQLAHCRALQLVLPVTGGFTHLTAARLHGWWLPPLPDDLPCWVAVPESAPRPRRRELRTKRLRVMPAPVLRDTVRVLPASEVLLACARDLGTLDMVVLSTRRCGPATSRSSP
jgi:hypothetical protein